MDEEALTASVSVDTSVEGKEDLRRETSCPSRAEVAMLRVCILVGQELKLFIWE